VALNLGGCGKYEDGPMFSLRTKEARLVGEWEVTKMNNESPDDDAEIILDFEKDGDLKITTTYFYYGNEYEYTTNGEWEWGSKKESLKITLVSDADNETFEWEIKRLTNEELWVEENIDGEVNSWEFEKK